MYDVMRVDWYHFSMTHRDRVCSKQAFHAASSYLLALLQLESMQASCELDDLRLQLPGWQAAGSLISKRRCKSVHQKQGSNSTIENC